MMDWDILYVWIQTLRKYLYPSLKQTWKVVGFVRVVERDMSQARTILAQSFVVTGYCYIHLKNRWQNFACQKLRRFLGRKKCEEFKKNVRNQVKKERKENIYGKIRQKVVLFVCLLYTYTCKIQQKDARPTPWM